MLIEIATLLTQAPDTQLDQCFRDRLKKLLDEQADNQAIFEVFKEIHSGSCGCESSSFVKAVVDPKYTQEYL
jgi:hypothetical protein